ncbi:MAG: hypothetical protein M1294_12810 [Firmicutes bacterium]|jgi:hypothetical protein|uniref:Uncharacterized protein n=1 Tax=Sulfobacillus benefaciens TaxID=453960 RepID=A0A2T2X9Z2_9FIRM|nr:hypothetical protein [Bacillota bacterium]MCL5015348.1 hypothetical protein [Bacillota bacterium]PSR31333.1 MAG: hypothetical protein C7B43_02905 [Sulfobacillus benefaciens]
MIVANMMLLLDAGLVVWIVGIVLLRGLCHVHRLGIHGSRPHTSVVIFGVCRKKYVIRSFKVVWRIIASQSDDPSHRPRTGGSSHTPETRVRRIK